MLLEDIPRLAERSRTDHTIQGDEIVTALYVVKRLIEKALDEVGS